MAVHQLLEAGVPPSQLLRPPSPTCRSNEAAVYGAIRGFLRVRGVPLGHRGAFCTAGEVAGVIRWGPRRRLALASWIREHPRWDGPPGSRFAHTDTRSSSVAPIASLLWDPRESAAHRTHTLGSCAPNTRQYYPDQKMVVACVPPVWTLGSSPGTWAMPGGGGGKMPPELHSTGRCPP